MSFIDVVNSFLNAEHEQEEEKEEQVPKASSRCQGLTNKQVQCKRKVVGYGKLCWQHGGKSNSEGEYINF